MRVVSCSPRTNSFFSLLSLLLLILLLPVAASQIDSHFTEEQTQLIKVASDLSGEVYLDTAFPPRGSQIVVRYTSGAQAAILARYDGNCIVAFRGNTLEQPNLPYLIDTSTERVCSGRRRRDCCQMRRGVVDTWESLSFLDDLQDQLDQCATGCSDCVVFTGHSVGASLATVAGLVWGSAYNPYVLTFGEPPTVQSFCADTLDTNRWFRFVNTAGGLGTNQPDLLIDGYAAPFPAVGNLQSVGHLFLIPNDPSRVAYMGHNVQYTTVFGCFDGCVDMNPSLGSSGGNNGEEGYRQRVSDLYHYAQNQAGQQQGQIPTTGFQVGDSCITDAHCELGRCDSVCLEPLPNCRGCDEHSDCQSRRCELRIVTRGECPFFPFQAKCWPR